MTTSDNDPAGIEPVQPVDPDLAEQAVQGHGVPSQDPDNSAQVGLLPEEAEREAKSAFAGGGAIAGLAAGAAVGAAVVGGAVGTLVGALGGEAAGSFKEAEPSDGGDPEPTDVDDTQREIPPR